MPLISGGTAFLEILKQEGVAFIFGNPGSTELPLMDALQGQKEMRYFMALHEGVAISMADGYAVASGKLGVVNVHTTPGIGNSMGMLYNAYKANAPLLVTAGQHDQRFLVTEPILHSYLPEVAKPYVKWSSEILHFEDLPRIIHRAAKVAASPPMGPVFLSLPVDVLKAEGEIDLGASTRIDPRLRASRAAIEAAAEMLSRANHPVIIAGDAVARGDAHKELARVAELLGAPVYQQTVSGTCNFPSSHPLSLGPIPRIQKAARNALQDADVLFSVGADLLTMSLPSEIDPIPPGLPIIHLHLDPWEIGKNYPAQIAVLGDPKETLPELEKALAERLTPGGKAEAEVRLARVGQAKEKALSVLRRKAKEERERMPITPLALMEAVCDNLPGNSVVVDETISSGRALRVLLKSEDPHSYYGMRGGGIGWGIPAALGVKLALGDRPVVALIGDGSAMYSYQGLWTAAHYGLAVTFVICNNSSYRILKERTHALGGFSAKADSYIGMDLEQPRIDFVGLAKALGVPGERCERSKEVKGALARALRQQGPVLIDVQLDRSFKP
ncbi:MAG: thiamine pyrophosphate-binding protein [Thermodesulfobacteriota bacterium]|nr:thiamine pyrophosphate-binding protein [Thermodesulfobacteriota bacterium]